MDAILDMYGKVYDICSSVYGVVNQSVCYTKPNVLTCSRKSNLLIFPDLNQCLNRIINFSCISFGSIFACGRAESEACRGSTGVSKDTEDFKRREEMSFLNKGPDLFLFCIKVKA